MKSTLTHFDKTGSAQMVDVTDKAETHRIAVAACTVNLSSQSVQLIKDGDAKKGDVLGVARLAGIIAAKKTSDIIPLCHPLSLSKISIEFIINADHNHIEIQASRMTLELDRNDGSVKISRGTRYARLECERSIFIM